MKVSDERDCYIYSLAGPDGVVRYVGWTVDPKRRFWKHTHDRSATHKARWIRQLAAAGYSPTMEILETTDGQHYAALERKWIKLFRERGNPLTNLTDGGDGVLGFVMPPAAIEKYASQLRGRPKSADHRRHLSVSRTGNPNSLWTEDRKAERSRLQTGRKPSQEAIEKTRLAHIGSKRSAEFVERQSLFLRAAYANKLPKREERVRLAQLILLIAEWRRRRA